ncbi:MAG: enoyl-CoA hydratase/isomerase family protein [Sulfitobacter sp.]
MIDLTRDGAVWTITINRPEKANSLTHKMLSQLADIMEDAQAARAVILTGQGKVFSAGADLDEARAGLAKSEIWERLSGAIAALPGFSVAALNGTLAGGAMGMALACDLRISVTQAKFFYPVMKLGFLPQPSDPARMAALIGPARTKLILMGGQKITANEALAFGLIDQIIPDKDLMDHAMGLVADTVAAQQDIAMGIKSMCTANPLGRTDPVN